MSAAEREILPLDALELGRPSCSREEAIRFVGEMLVARGHVDADYVDGMLLREQTVSTYLGNGIAMPHGTFESRDAVHSTGIVVAQYPDGVEFELGTAHVVIGLAAIGDDHVAILSHIAEILQDEEVAEQLWTTSDINLVHSTLTTTIEEEAGDAAAIGRSITISGEGGLHARPASLIVDFAKSFEGEITLTKGDKTAKAGSIMSLLALGATANDTVNVNVSATDDADSEAAYQEVERILTTPEDEL